MRKNRSEGQFIDPILYIGVGLVVIGTISLLYLVIAVAQVLKSPEEAELIQWVMLAAKSNEMILSGNFGEESFSIQASEAFQYILLCILGLIVVRLLTSIFTAFVNKGVALVSTARSKTERCQGDQ